MLLELLYLAGSLVTIEAMGCQKAIAESILAKGADYLLAVKEHQPTLYEAIDRLYFESDDKAFVEQFTDSAQSVDKGHGRVERRGCWVCYELSALQEYSAVWPGLKALVVIESHRTVGDKTSVEHRLYISSKKQSAAYFLQATRDHWQVENKLHWPGFSRRKIC